MEIILTEQCVSFTGSLGRGFGYSIQKRKDRFYGKRDSKGDIPFGGHWRFIIACAEMAKEELLVSDILVNARELREAINEAGLIYGGDLKHAKNGEIYHASQVLEFRKRWAL